MGVFCVCFMLESLWMSKIAGKFGSIPRNTIEAACMASECRGVCGLCTYAGGVPYDPIPLDEPDADTVRSRFGISAQKN